MASSLVVDRVVKRYGSFTAVDGVSFTAEPGRIMGLLGPNGAGKTSTIRMVTYITVPDEGQITLGGQTVSPATQQRMGYLPEERGLYKKMKVGDQLVYLTQLKGLGKAEAERAVKHWLDRLGAAEWYGKKVEELSKGMQQKVQFVSTIAHDPDLLIFDEPFSGLDPINAEILKDVILELRAAGKTILFASHRMEQVEQLCDDICLIAQGRVLLSGTPREVKSRYGRNTATVEWEGGDAWLDALEAQRAVHVVNRSAGRAEVRLEGETPSRAVLEAALAGTDDLYRFDLHAPPLSEVFVLAVNEDDRVRAAPQAA